MTYTKQLDARYIEESQHMDLDSDFTKLVYLGESIFSFVTYDSGLDEILARKMLDVLSVLINKTTYEYIENKDNYINYITMVNMPFLINKLEWGTSIRGAWLDVHDYSEPPIVYEIDGIRVPKTEFEVFVKDLIEWAK